MVQYAGDLTHYLDHDCTNIRGNGIGSSRRPRQGQKLQFDRSGGSHGNLASQVTLIGDFAIAVYFEFTGDRAFVLSRSTNEYLEVNNGGFLRLKASDGSSSVTIVPDSAFVVGQEYHLLWRRIGTLNELFVDGVKQLADSTSSGAQFAFDALSINNTSFVPSGSMRDIRAYDLAPSDADCAQIAAGEVIGAELHRWIGLEETGTETYDSVGGNTVSWQNIVESTFRQSDPTIENPANSEGFSENAGVIVPADFSNPGFDVLGTSLDFTGQVEFLARVDTPCVTGDGTAVNIQIDGAARPDVLEIWFKPTTLPATDKRIYSYRDQATQLIQLNQKTASPNGIVWQARSSANALGQTEYEFPELDVWYKIRGEIDYGASGEMRLYVNDVLVDSGAVDLSGTLASSQTTLLGQRTSVTTAASGFNNGQLGECSIVAGGITHHVTGGLQAGAARTVEVVNDTNDTVITGSIVGGVENDIWDNRCPGFAKSHCIEFGGGIDGVSGAFIPGIPTTSNDAAGNPKTLVAGKGGNPHERVIRNPFNVAEVPVADTVEEQWSDIIEDVAPVNTRFNERRNDGTAKLVTTSPALSGQDLTDLETFLGNA